MTTDTNHATQAARAGDGKTLMLPPLPSPDAQRAEWDEPDAQTDEGYFCLGWTQYHDESDPLPGQWDDEAPTRVIDLFTVAQMQAYALAAAPAALPPGVVVSAYRVGDGINAVKVERAQQIDGPDLWAVRRHGDVLSRTGEWEWEPMPSSRDDEFLARCRFDTHTAALAALYAAVSPAPATAAAAEGSQP